MSTVVMALVYRESELGVSYYGTMGFASGELVLLDFNPLLRRILVFAAARFWICSRSEAAVYAGPCPLL